MKTVYLTDEKISYEQATKFFEEAATWAKQTCSSFVTHHVQDVSDVSYVYDHIAEYRFNDARDAMFFELKWK